MANISVASAVSSNTEKTASPSSNVYATTTSYVNATTIVPASVDGAKNNVSFPLTSPMQMDNQVFTSTSATNPSASNASRARV